ncbi:unnamed protein product [Clonostachys byssicola]|uniref:Uncharacterized protein n=1 Tax=Clonostachys byssicola TaxID=160290 RepID=A0A9N9UAB9_9HYPO|nr:unnamed protein product [Clonostachys byssicola]
MLTSKRLYLFLACLAAFVAPSLGQRPSTASLCDYYATALYGANNSNTQWNLIRHIVSLAFEGGSELTNKSSELTGILRPGKFGGVDIDLRQYFNGSRASTNVNNAPIGINWLDQGGTVPLSDFLTGRTDTVVMSNSSNQYHLFGNFFVSFSRAFACSIPYPSLPNSAGPVQLSYAHKFMNLEYNQLGHFINQLSQAAIYYGFSTQDAETFRTRLNSQYNVRCAPPVTFNPAMGPQLLSLCQNPTCPLAVPVSDCAAYNNLTANGIADSSPTTVTATATATATASSAPSSSATSASPATQDEDKLTKGAIAGIAIGGAAVLVLAIAAFFFVRRRRNKTPPPPPPSEPTAAWVGSQHFSSPTLDPTTPAGRDRHASSYFSTGPPPSEMASSRYQSPVELNAKTGDPYLQQWAATVSHPVEMDSSPAGEHQWSQDQGGEIQQAQNQSQSHTYHQTQDEATRQYHEGNYR